MALARRPRPPAPALRSAPIPRIQPLAGPGRSRPRLDGRTRPAAAHSLARAAPRERRNLPVPGARQTPAAPAPRNFPRRGDHRAAAPQPGFLDAFGLVGGLAVGPRGCPCRCTPCWAAAASTGAGTPPPCTAPSAPWAAPCRPTYPSWGCCPSWLPASWRRSSGLPKRAASTWKAWPCAATRSSPKSCGSAPPPAKSCPSRPTPRPTCKTGSRPA